MNQKYSKKKEEAEEDAEEDEDEEAEEDEEEDAEEDEDEEEDTDLNIAQLLKALNNEENESLINLTSKKIMELNHSVLKELLLPKQVHLDYLKKLERYKYVDEIKDLHYGAYVRWIPIKDPQKMPLYTGGIICDIQVTDNGVNIKCKNFQHRFYQFKMDECLVFQKLTYQENVLLTALNHLSK